MTNRQYYASQGKRLSVQARPSWTTLSTSAKRIRHQPLRLRAREIQEGPRNHGQLLSFGIDEIPVVLEGEALNVEAQVSRRFWIEPEGVARHDGDAEAREDRLLDGLVRAQLHSDPGSEP